jgi:hypothetical protein
MGFTQEQLELYEAILEDNVPVATAALEKGAEVTEAFPPYDPENPGKYPEGYAESRWKNSGVLPLFLTIFAGDRGSPGCMKVLLDKTADKEMKGPFIGERSPAWTPLQFAVGSGRLGCVRALIDAGANVNASNPQKNNLTPLMLASGAAPAQEGHNDIAEFLLQNEAEIEARHDGGETALDIAIKENKPEIVKLILIQKLNNPRYSQVKQICDICNEFLSNSCLSESHRAAQQEEEEPPAEAEQPEGGTDEVAAAGAAEGAGAGAGAGAGLEVDDERDSWSLARRQAVGGFGPRKGRRNVKRTKNIKRMKRMKRTRKKSRKSKRISRKRKTRKKNK